MLGISTRCALLAVAVVASAAVNDRPIIGILTQPLNTEIGNSSKSNTTYIAASYVKFVESAGARAAPVHFDAPDAEIKTLLKSLNGLLMPGGGADITNSSRFGQATKSIWEFVLEINRAGTPFPVHGTCMGFQQLAVLAAESDSVICTKCFDTEGTPLPLVLAPGAKQSPVFSGMSAELLAAVQTENITENSHHDGVRPSAFASGTAFPQLSKFFTVLSTNEDGRGQQFVSTMLATDFGTYPISATQWHPEKNNFEWGGVGAAGLKAIPHSAHAVALSQSVADYFVGQARRSQFKFESEAAESAALIYSQGAPQKDPNGYFQQVYLWAGRS
eukprot:g731.t1